VLEEKEKVGSATEQRDDGRSLAAQWLWEKELKSASD
jgi:hypothetical protein